MKSVQTLPINIQASQRAARRRSAPERRASRQSFSQGSAGSEPLSLPSASHLDAVLGSSAPIAMQIALSASRLPPTHPTKIAANALALTQSFDAAPEDLDHDPEKYHSPLSGRLHAYQSMNARLLQRVAQEPRIKGFGYWLHDMCNARIKSPKTQRPHAENLVRRLFELVEALYLCAETDADTVIDVGCDITKRDDPNTMILRSSDIAVMSRKEHAVRHIEVTSVGVQVRSTHELDRAIRHVVDKMDTPVGTHEGAIAIDWADDALPETILGDMLELLNDEHARQPWRAAQALLDRIVLMRYDPEHADCLAIFERYDDAWYACQGPFMRQEDILPPPPQSDDEPFEGLNVEALAREFHAATDALPSLLPAQRRAPGHDKARKV